MLFIEGYLYSNFAHSEHIFQFFLYDETLDFKSKYLILCEKYILKTSEYALNISYDTNLNLRKYYYLFRKNNNNQNGGIDKVNLSNIDKIIIFNKALLELCDNLFDSYLRFTRSDDYIVVKNVYNDIIKNKNNV